MICPSWVFLFVPSWSDRGQSHSLSQTTTHQPGVSTQQDAFRVPQSAADTTGSSRQLILAVGYFWLMFWFLLYVQGLESEVFSIIYLCVACSSCCYFVYFLLHINQATVSGMNICVREKSEWVSLHEWKIKCCKFSNKSWKMANNLYWKGLKWREVQSRANNSIVLI